MEEKAIYTPYRWLMLLAASLAIMSAYVDMIAISPILGEVAKGLSIDMAAATNLMMGFVLAIACVLIWGGIVCDKYGVTTALVLGLLCATVPATLMPWIGDSYGTVLILRLIQGASIGFIFAVIGPVTALWFPPKEQGIASGIMIAFIPAGSALGVVLSPMILASGRSWQTTVALLSLLGWVSILLALLITRKPPSPEVVQAATKAMQSTAGKMSFGKALAQPITWLGCIVSAFNTWNLYCILNLIPTYLAEKPPLGVGLGPVTAGRLALISTIVGIFATLAGGIFFDKTAKGRPRPGMQIGFVLTALFIYPIIFPSVYSNMFLLIGCLMLFGWGVNFVGPSVSGFIARIYPPNIVGRMVGWWFGFSTFFGALGIYLGGRKIAQTGSFNWTMKSMAFSAVIGFILAMFLRYREKQSTN
jgi:MFS family permease